MFAEVTQVRLKEAYKILALLCWGTTYRVTRQPPFPGTVPDFGCLSLVIYKKMHFVPVLGSKKHDLTVEKEMSTVPKEISGKCP